MIHTDEAELLRARARDLARPLATGDTSQDLRTVMRFRLDGIGYAIPLQDIQRVVPLRGAARLPTAAHPLVALTAVAGAIVPVVGLAPSTGGLGNAVWAVAVAVPSDGTLVCLPADEVTGLAELSENDVTTSAAPDDEIASTGEITRAGDLLIDAGRLGAVLARDARGSAAAIPTKGHR